MINIYNWFIDLDNLIKIIVYYLIIGMMTCLGHPDKVYKVSTL